MENLLKNLFNPFKRNLQVSRFIYNHFSEHLEEYGESYTSFDKLHALQITDILCRKEKDLFVIKITLGRPSFLIGRGGRTIDNLRASLSMEMKMPVKIDIKEHDLWIFNKYKK